MGLGQLAVIDLRAVHTSCYFRHPAACSNAGATAARRRREGGSGTIAVLMD